MKLYLDLYSGISGDMFCGALINLGVPFDYLKNELEKLNIDGYKLDYKIKNVNGISCGDFNVILDHTNHFHHHHNTLINIIEIINNSNIAEKAKEIAIKVFNVLAQAEAKVHNMDIENIHFHEVGAVDSIIDIVGASICLDYLKADEILFSKLPSFYGEIQCAHGIIPLPAPAVSELTVGMLWNNLNTEGELITPTGAAILRALGKQDFKREFSFGKIGYGSGKRETERGNFLRVFEFNEWENSDSVIDIEFNIDDMNPELEEPLTDALFSAGALDVMMFSGMMKKQRMGLMVKIICKKQNFDEICKAVFENSTTIGIRYSIKDRVCLQRRTCIKDTNYGKIEYKETLFQGKVVNSKPEYMSVKKIAKDLHIPIKELMNKL